MSNEKFTLAQRLFEMSLRVRGLSLASLGKLPEATRFMIKQVADTRLELVSLGKLNRSLQEENRHSRSYPSPKSR